MFGNVTRLDTRTFGVLRVVENRIGRGRLFLGKRGFGATWKLKCGISLYLRPVLTSILLSGVRSPRSSVLRSFCFAPTFIGVAGLRTCLRNLIRRTKKIIYVGFVLSVDNTLINPKTTRFVRVNLGTKKSKSRVRKVFLRPFGFSRKLPWKIGKKEPLFRRIGKGKFRAPKWPPRDGKIFGWKSYGLKGLPFPTLDG